MVQNLEYLDRENEWNEHSKPSVTLTNVKVTTLITYSHHTTHIYTLTKSLLPVGMMCEQVINYNAYNDHQLTENNAH